MRNCIKLLTFSNVSHKFVHNSNIYYLSLKVFCCILKFPKKNLVPHTYIHNRTARTSCSLPTLWMAYNLKEPVRCFTSAFVKSSSGLFWCLYKWSFSCSCSVRFCCCCCCCHCCRYNPLLQLSFSLCLLSLTFTALHLPGTTQSCPGGKIKLQFL